MHDLRRYENWLATVLFIGLLVLFTLVLDLRRDVASLKRDAAYNTASAREAPSRTIGLEERIKCLEGQRWAC